MKERVEIEAQRLREMIITDDVEFDSEYQAFLIELRPIASKLYFEAVNSKIFSEK